ncbi:MAG: ORF6N domain-containing protein [Candidatus Margulisiibacteriota bacterium]
MEELIPDERIENKIYLIRGQKVMLDSDLANLYGVKTKNLNKAVNRNSGRFPADFMLQLTAEEFELLRFQFGTSKCGGRRYLPYAFTELGVAMLSSVLSSDQAVQVNIGIMRAFARLRQIIVTNKALFQKIEQLEKKHSKHEIEITTIFKVLKQLMTTPEKPKKKIGFIQ